MAAPFTEVEAPGVDGELRVVRITNPDKVFFPARGETKLDLARYYLAVGDGALRGVLERPTVLKRYPDGATEEPFFQKRVPAKRPGVDRDGPGDLPERAPRRRAVPGRRRPHRVGREPGLPRPQPVGGAPGRRRPPRRAAGRPRPAAGRAVRRRARGRGAGARRARGARVRRLPEDVGVAGHPHQRAHRAALGLHRVPARRARARA